MKSKEKSTDRVQITLPEIDSFKPGEIIMIIEFALKRYWS